MEYLNLLHRMPLTFLREIKVFHDNGAKRFQALIIITAKESTVMITNFIIIWQKQYKYKIVKYSNTI